jgi:hypothetical protein
METIKSQARLIKKLHKRLQIPDDYGLNFIYTPGEKVITRRDPPAPLLTVSTRQKALYQLREAGIIEELSNDAVLDRITRRLNQAFVESDRRTPVGRKPGK